MTRKSEPRLDLADEQLAAHLTAATPEQCRAAAQAVCTLAATSNPIDDERYVAAREALGQSAFGDTPARRELHDLVEQLDDEQWDAQDAGRHDEHAEAFQRARTANALWCALDNDPTWAALEAAYEAFAAIGEEREALRSAVLARGARRRPHRVESGATRAGCP